MRGLVAGFVSASLTLSSCSAAAAPSSTQKSASSWPTCGQVDVFPGPQWPTPQISSGWDAERLRAAETLFESLDSAAVMVIHRGRLIAAWGEVGKIYTAQSMRKALISSLVGIAVDQGRLHTSDTLEKLRINDTNPALTSAERQTTLRDVLMSRSGIFHSALYEHGSFRRVRGGMAERKRAEPQHFVPGAYWMYNNWDFNVIGTIVENAFQRPLGPLFTEYLARPLQMQEFGPENVEYTTKEDATEQYFQNWSEHRAYVVNISTRDVARYGLLYLNCGAWKGRQIVSRDWVFESLRGRPTREGRGVDEQDTGMGDYGYLWQIERPGSRRLTNLPTRQPVYSATGARGHFMIIAPYLDLVIAHQVATEGGVSLEAQKKRAVEGSPEVSEEDLGRLFRAIIEAHPDRSTAFEESGSG